MKNVKDANLYELITAQDTGSGSYPIEKLQAHRDNVPHVAVSIFVFRNQQMLLQKRADSKYHSGGLWANTVCSHPRWNEPASACAKRRLQEELGWSTALKKFGSIDYTAQVGELYENEHVHCFLGSCNETVSTDNFNRDEVSAVKWLSIQQILHEIASQPEAFTEWFKIYMTRYVGMINFALSGQPEIDACS